ncbi:MAG: UDP-N-acetylmuramoyl-L-alanine--D-glutamate ligase [Pseudomonadota bacterium]
MIPVRGYDGRRVAVLGLGRSGLAAARALRAGGATPVCWDDQPPARDRAEAEGFKLIDLRQADQWDGIECLVCSPGIPHLYPAPHPVVEAAWAAGAVVDNDIGLFFRSYGTPEWDRFDVLPRVVCVTGSNGKSTTTALITHILDCAGRNVQMGGNIGRGVLDLDPATDGQITVLELSSYQTDLARALAPDIAVFLNLSADHLDRHGGMGGYFAAKARLFTAGGPDRAIIGTDEIEGRFLATRLRETAPGGEPVITLTRHKPRSAGWTVAVRKGFLAEWRSGRQVASVDLRAMVGLPGAHNHQNAAAAWAVCRSIGLSPREIEAALPSFSGLRHRCQRVARVAGVDYVNDSKATNADAAAQALSAFARIRWIAGGEAKDGGIASLSRHFDRVAKAYLIGASAQEFAAQLGVVPHTVAGTLDAALAQAASEAEPGDTVLLAPAAASFDQFANFETRGEAFETLVRALGDRW